MRQDGGKKALSLRQDGDIKLSDRKESVHIKGEKRTEYKQKNEGKNGDKKATESIHTKEERKLQLRKSR